jgi:large subunit ribosomal protein L18
MAKRSRQDVRRAIHSRIRKKVRGDESRPRLAVFRSVNHIYAQLINDDEGVTICSASTVEKGSGGGKGGNKGGNIDAAKVVGRLIAERAKDKGVTRVVFDRGGYIYHGRVRALAEAAREAGLQF